MNGLKKGDIVRFKVNSPDGIDYARKGQLARLVNNPEEDMGDNFLTLLAPRSDQYKNSFWAYDKEIEPL